MGNIGLKDIEITSTRSEISRQSLVKLWVFVLAAFCLSRIVYYYAGICFDTSGLSWYWQYIDTHLLKNNLAQSLYYLHNQPPLFNLLLGFVLKLFPNYEELALNFIYLFLGLGFATVLFLLMINLAVHPKISAVLTILFIVSPPCILYENWFFYTYPVAVLLCLSALCLNLYLKTTKIRYAFAFSTFLACISLTRSMFHILWLLIALMILFLHNKPNWKRIVWAISLPVFLVIFWYAKNLYVFGNFSSSTWLGMSLAKITSQQLSQNHRERLIEQDKISRVSLVKPFSGLQEYQGLYPESIFCRDTSIIDIPVLYQKEKTGGHPNFNHLAYIDISKQYLADAFYVLKNHPKPYLRSLSFSFSCFFLPASDHLHLAHNRSHITGLNRIFGIICNGRMLRDSTGEIIRFRREGRYGRILLNIGLFLLIGIPILTIYGFSLLVTSFKRRNGDKTFSLTLLFILLNIMYVGLVGNFLEFGENNRFRFLIDPFLLVILGLFLDQLIKKYRQRDIKEFCL